MARLGTETPHEAALGTGEAAVVQRALHLLERYPQDQALHRSLAAYYVRNAMAELAIGRLRVLLDLYPDDPESLGILAAYFDAFGAPDKAKLVWTELSRTVAVPEQARAMVGYRRARGLPASLRLRPETGARPVQVVAAA